MQDAADRARYLDEHVHDVPRLGFTKGTELAAAERYRQQQAEGYTLAQDAAYDDGTLESAAVAYLEAPFHRHGPAPMVYPWPEETWKPTPDDRLRELVKAAALAIAAIDRELTLQGLQ